MFRDRKLFGNVLMVLIVLVHLALFGYSAPSQPMQEDNQIVKVRENTNFPEHNLMRSGTELLAEGSCKASFDCNFITSEQSYSSSVLVHFFAVQVAKADFRSSVRIYLHLLCIIV